MEGDESRFNAFDLHALHHVFAEVQTCGGSGDSPFVFGEDALETFQIFWFGRAFDDFMRNGSFAKCIELLAELIVIAIVEEAQGTATACGVVDYLGHDGVVFSKVELVANTDFTSRVYEDIPKAKVAVEFTQKEHFDACTSLLLVAVEASREDLSVVEYEDIFFIEILQEIFELTVFNFACLAMEHQHTAVIAMGSRVFCNLLLRELILELRQFHK